MRDGAYDFIEKPFAAERLIETVRRALEPRSSCSRTRGASWPGRTSSRRIIGRSPAIEQGALIANVAPTDASVLINGDTGAGGADRAQPARELSPRRDKPFIAVNCGALPEPMFESEMFGYGSARVHRRREAPRRQARICIGRHAVPRSAKVARAAGEVCACCSDVLERLGSNQPIRVNCRVVAAAKGDMSGPSRPARSGATCCTASTS